MHVAPKRKDAANPVAAALAKQAKPGHGGARAGHRREAEAHVPINTPGADAADAPKRKQLNIGALLDMQRSARAILFGLYGERRAEQPPTPSPTRSQQG